MFTRKIKPPDFNAEPLTTTQEIQKAQAPPSPEDQVTESSWGEGGAVHQEDCRQGSGRKNR